MARLEEELAKIKIIQQQESGYEGKSNILPNHAATVL
jgi:hypothetical protein